MNADLRDLRQRQLATLEAREHKDQSCLDTIALIKQQLGEAGVAAAAAQLAADERAELERLRARVLELERVLEAERADHARTRELLADAAKPVSSAAVPEPTPAQAQTVAVTKRKR